MTERLAILRMRRQAILAIQGFPRALGLGILLCGLSSGLVLAQAPSPAAAPAEPAEEKGLAIGALDVKTELEVGYRWASGVRGSTDMYRSQINLGQGVRLLHFSTDMEGPLGASPLFDKLHITMDNWGDPYNTLRMRAQKSDVYTFTFNYQKIQYFNFIPAFANPLLGQGILLGQHSYDTGRRIMDFTLTLRPGQRVRPYFGYSRNSDVGPGLTTLAAEGNEFVVNSRIRNTANDYKAGVELSFPRLALVLEQGFRSYKDDQQVSQPEGNNPGNSTRPVFGRSLFLTDLLRNYRVRGTTPISRVLLKATPVSNVSFTGRFIYTNADVDAVHQQLYQGLFFSLPLLRFFRRQDERSMEKIRQPNLFTDVAVEYQPIKKLRLIETFQTHRYHSSGASDLFRLFFNTENISGPPQPSDIAEASALDTFFSLNVNRNQFEGVYQWTPKLALRAGYRYRFEETTLTSTRRADNERQSESARFHQHVLLAGLTYRLTGKLDANLDYERGGSDQVLMRTDPRDYNRLRLRGRYQATRSLRISGALSLFDHRNGRSDLDYRGRNRGYDLSVAYLPSEKMEVVLDYSRSDIHSNILYLLPQTFTLDRSIYMENSHSLNAILNFEIIRQARISLGYQVLGVTGSFPLNFHQPFANLSIPINKRLRWVAGWRYYGYNEKGVSFEDYRRHLISSSLVINY